MVEIGEAAIASSLGSSRQRAMLAVVATAVEFLGDIPALAMMLVFVNLVLVFVPDGRGVVEALVTVAQGVEQAPDAFVRRVRFEPVLGSGIPVRFWPSCYYVTSSITGFHIHNRARGEERHRDMLSAWCSFSVFPVLFPHSSTNRLRGTFMSIPFSYKL